MQNTAVIFRVSGRERFGDRKLDRVCTTPVYSGARILRLFPSQCRSELALQRHPSMRPPASGQSWTGVNPKCVRHRKRPADWHSFTRSVRPERLYSKCEQEHRPIPAHSTRGLDSLLHTSPCSRDSRLGCHSSTRLHPARSAVLPCNDALPAPTQAPRLPPLQQIRVSRFHLDLPIRPCISLDPLFQPPNASQFHPRYVSHSALRSFGVPQTNLTRRSSARESNPKPWTGLTPKVASLGKKAL